MYGGWITMRTSRVQPDSDTWTNSWIRNFLELFLFPRARSFRINLVTCGKYSAYCRSRIEFIEILTVSFLLFLLDIRNRFSLLGCGTVSWSRVIEPKLGYKHSGIIVIVISVGAEDFVVLFSVCWYPWIFYFPRVSLPPPRSLGPHYSKPWSGTWGRCKLLILCVSG